MTTSPNPLGLYQSAGQRARPMPDVTPEMQGRPDFKAVWALIKSWDIAVPESYGGYCGATGGHVRAILDAIAGTGPRQEPKP